ncbi:MAG: GNAT family N-acetyltransferase [Clostridia bacterium]|nr:GNAT family N-acetyltransferase [Clostridia bacterium]
MCEIRPFKKENIDFIFHLMSEEKNLSALHTNIISSEEWQNIFAKAKGDTDEENFIVYKNDTPCCWLKLNGLQNQNTAWISMLVVSEKFKHQGVGKFAVSYAVEYLTGRGYELCKLQTTKDNLPAINLYKKCGFELTEPKAKKLTFCKKLNNFSFVKIAKENATQHKNLRKVFAKYKIRVLRNHGESPCGKKTFYKLFDSIVSSACENKTKHFIVMESDKDLIGFALIETASTDVVDIPYRYGEINDFYISSKHRRKGYGRILNNHIESIFKADGVNTVLLSPDPVSGIDFWKAMGYCDTGIHQGWGRHFVYIKHLTEKDVEIENTISALVTPTELITVNPYNKAQIKEMHDVWKKYCRENNKNYRRSTVRKMAFKARKNKEVVFMALYSQGRIIGFVYKDGFEMRYGLTG